MQVRFSQRQDSLKRNDVGIGCELVISSLQRRQMGFGSGSLSLCRMAIASAFDESLRHSFPPHVLDQTVKNHIRRICGKVGADGRLEILEACRTHAQTGPTTTPIAVVADDRPEGRGEAGGGTRLVWGRERGELPPQPWGGFLESCDEIGCSSWSMNGALGDDLRSRDVTPVKSVVRTIVRPKRRSFE